MNDDLTKTEKEISAVQEHIADLMHREVILSREVLASMREEESALLHHDDSALANVMNRRDLPLQELKSIRQQRVESVKDLVKLLFQKQGNLIEKEVPKAFSLLDVTDIQNCEVFVLRDQLIALIEKMNTQQANNMHLLNHYHEYAEMLNDHLDGWGYSIMEQKKKGPAVITSEND